jgi:hypothetical protein
VLHFLSLLHTISVYAARWGGPRYRTTEVAKYINKYCYNLQEEHLKRGKKIDTRLASEAILSSRHTPLYIKSLHFVGYRDAYVIVDELGLAAVFPEGTEILVEKNAELTFVSIDELQPGDKRVVNFEYVKEFKNASLHSYNKHIKNFITIKSRTERETQIMLCDSITAMTLTKEIEPLKLKKLYQFDNKLHDQELYLIDIVSVTKTKTQMPSINLELFPYSHALIKDVDRSKKTDKRYYKAKHKERGKKYLNKMREKVFDIKNSKIDIVLESIDVTNTR